MAFYGWVDLDDRKPSGGPCLVTDGSSVLVAYWHPDDGWLGITTEFESGIRYWAPMPRPPRPCVDNRTMPPEEIIADLRAEIGRRQYRIDELEAENARLAATRPSEPVRAWCEKLSHLVGEMPLDLLQFDQRPMDWSQLTQAEEDDQ